MGWHAGLAECTHGAQSMAERAHQCKLVGSLLGVYYVALWTERGTLEFADAFAHVW